MTETPFATFGDLTARWPSFPAGRDAYADVLLGDASAMVRDTYPNVDARIAAGTLRAESVKRIVCQMVKRAMPRDEDDGIESVQTSSGTLAETVKYSNPDGNLYLTGAEQRTLAGRAARTGRAGAVDLSAGVRPDWM